MASGICAIYTLEKRQNLRKAKRSSKRDIEAKAGERIKCQCRDNRQSKCEDHRKRGVCGYDAGKKVKGRKRHIAVDTQGFLLQAYVTSAATSDKKGCKKLLRSKKLKGLGKIWVDGGYQGEELKELAFSKGKDLEVVKRPSKRMRVYDEEWNAEWVPLEKGFTVLPRRWVVERTFAWIGRYRRMSKDYEYLPKTSETLVYACILRTMLNRINNLNI